MASAPDRRSVAGIAGLALLATAGTLTIVSAGAGVLTASTARQHAVAATASSWGSAPLVVPGVAAPQAHVTLGRRAGRTVPVRAQGGAEQPPVRLPLVVPPVALPPIALPPIALPPVAVPPVTNPAGAHPHLSGPRVTHPALGGSAHPQVGAVGPAAKASSHSEHKQLPKAARKAAKAGAKEAARAAWTSAKMRNRQPGSSGSHRAGGSRHGTAKAKSRHAHRAC
ncbi:MAG: hypothetical protein QOJ92_532 [Frankiales bacterium]|nr:hypothetical protein [Frankiales bacterium]